MNRCITYLLVAYLCLFSTSCGRHRSRPFLTGPGDNQYLIDVRVESNNTVIATVNLPEYHYGFLFLNNSNVALEVVIANGDVNFGVFQPGDYNLCLELFLSPDGEVLFDSYPPSFAPFTDLSGVQECVTFNVPVLDTPPNPNPDPKPECSPKIKVRINCDGVIVLVVKLCNYPKLILRRLFDNVDDYICENNFVHIVENLPCGEYVYVLIDPATDTELYRVTVEIPCPPEDDDSDNGDNLGLLPPEPEDPRTRFLICHNGHQILVPWRALRAHILIHGDKLGPCADSDGHGNDDDGANDSDN